MNYFGGGPPPPGVMIQGERVVEEDEIHVWRFDPNGKIIRFRHGVDTHLHHLAYNK